MTLVIPAIIPHAYRDIEEKVALVRGRVSRVQIDVIDGVFAPKASWPYNDVDIPKFRDLIDQKAGLPFWEEVEYELDMMVEKPQEKMYDWISAGVSTLIVHRESVDDATLFKIIDESKDRNVDVALALKPSTSNDLLAPFMEHISFVQCMGNDTIGSHGVSFDEKVLEKITDIRNRFNVSVGVDIGVNLETAPRIREAGATRLVSGSAIFGADASLDTIEKLAGN